MPLGDSESLRWFATTPNAQPWVPTEDELDQAGRELSGALGSATRNGDNDRDPSINVNVKTLAGLSDRRR